MKKLLSILLTAVLLIGTVAVLPVSAANRITKVEITIDAPVDGEKPSYTATFPDGAPYRLSGSSGSEFERNGITWECLEDDYMDPSGGRFAAGKTYKVTIVLVCDDGDSFSSATDAVVNGGEATRAERTADTSVTVSETFTCSDEKEEITSVYIPLSDPVGGEAPSYSITIPEYYGCRVMDYNSAGKYKNGIAWVRKSDGYYLDPDNDVLDYNETYVVYVWLEPKNGSYCFPEDADDIDVDFGWGFGEASVVRLEDGILVVSTDGVKTPREIKDYYVLQGNSNWLDLPYGPDIDKYVLSETGDGKYSITVPDVPVTPEGEYCKFTIVLYKNANEYDRDFFGVGDYAYNVVFCVKSKCDVTVTFDPATEEITVDGSGVARFARGFGSLYACVYGAEDEEPLEDFYEDNSMTEVSKGVYEVVYNTVAPGDYMLFLSSYINGDVSTTTFGTVGEWDEENPTVINTDTAVDCNMFGNLAKFTLTETCDVTIRLDTTGMDWMYMDGAKMSVITSPPTTPKERYKLWLGETRVTEDNKDDILSDGGSASFDPETCTLTLSDPVINGQCTISDNCKIFATGFDLTVKGSYHMTASEGGYGIILKEGDLTLDGDFTFLSSYNAVYVFDGGGLTVSSGSLKAVSEYFYAVYASGNVVIADGVTRLEAQCENGDAISGKTIKLGDELEITSPEGCVIKHHEGCDSDMFYEADGEYRAEHVVIERKQSGETVTYIRGDVDNSGTVNVFDASYILKGTTGTNGYPDYKTMDKSSTDFKRADADGNGTVNVFDAAIVLKHVSGDKSVEKYGIGKTVNE